jgi:hypothetical protein
MKILTKKKLDRLLTVLDKQMNDILDNFCAEVLQPQIKAVCDEYNLFFETGMGIWGFYFSDTNPWKEKLEGEWAEIVEETPLSKPRFDYNFVLYDDLLEPSLSSVKETLMDIYGFSEKEYKEVIPFLKWYKKAVKACNTIEKQLDETIPIRSDHSFGMYCCNYKPAEKGNKI